MSKHAKLIGAVALGAAAVLTFVLVQTAGKSPSSPAKVAAAIGAGDFAGVVAPNDVQVNCAPGATTGTADVRVQVTRTDLGATGGNLGPGGRVVVTWAGSDRSTTINRFDRSYRAGSGTTFPCPATEGQGVPTTFSFQLYKGSIAIGDAVLASANFFRFGSPS
jgi:hypothetical protein